MGLDWVYNKYSFYSGRELIGSVNLDFGPVPAITNDVSKLRPDFGAACLPQGDAFTGRTPLQRERWPIVRSGVCEPGHKFLQPSDCAPPGLFSYSRHTLYALKQLVLDTSNVPIDGEFAKLSCGSVGCERHPCTRNQGPGN